MVELNDSFWNKRYQDNEIGWDIGAISTPLKSYFDQLTNKNIKILIPGCGNAYEAEYLFKNGFNNVFLIDIATEVISLFKKRVPGFPHENIICGDFFEHSENYDLIVEQTFFCAILPILRPKYVKHASSLLKPNGKIIGLLFNDPLNTDKPPFGGNKEEYIEYFSPYFDIDIMENSINSIKPRLGRELFIKLIKK